MKIESYNNINTFNIISNKENKFELNLYIENNNLNIFLIKENCFNEDYNKTLSLEYLSSNSYFNDSNLENIKTILCSLLVINKFSLIEEENNLILIFDLNENDSEKLTIKIEKKIKDVFDLIKKLYKQINNIQIEIESLKESNMKLKVENRGMRQEINDLFETNESLKKKINKLEKLKNCIKKFNLIQNNNNNIDNNNNSNKNNKSEINKNSKENNLKQNEKLKISMNSFKNIVSLKSNKENKNIAYEKKEVPLFTININDYVNCLIILNDGRLAACSDDCLIHVYNIQTFKEELTIKDNNDSVNYIFEMNNKNLVSASSNGIINIYEIYKNNYKLIDKLKVNNSKIYKVIQCDYNSLISSHSDKQIYLWNKNINNEYKLESSMYYNYCIENIEELNDYEIIGTSKEALALIFYNIKIKRPSEIIKQIKCVSSQSSMCLIKEKNLLFLGGSYLIYIINVITKKIINCINTNNIINCIYYNISEYCLYTGEFFNIGKYLINENNLIIVSKKLNIHNDTITSITKLNNDLIATSATDKKIKIWKF
jgi:FtsZ-binding cell division protein ZapB